MNMLLQKFFNFHVILFSQHNYCSSGSPSPKYGCYFLLTTNRMIHHRIKFISYHIISHNVQVKWKLMGKLVKSAITSCRLVILCKSPHVLFRINLHLSLNILLLRVLYHQISTKSLVSFFSSIHVTLVVNEWVINKAKLPLAFSS